MKIDLIGMILNLAGRRHFEGLIIDESGAELDAEHSLDYMIMEYARVRNGGEVDIIVARIITKTNPATLSVNQSNPRPKTDQT